MARNSERTYFVRKGRIPSSRLTLIPPLALFMTTEAEAGTEEEAEREHVRWDGWVIGREWTRRIDGLKSLLCFWAGWSWLHCACFSPNPPVDINRSSTSGRRTT